MPRYEEDHYYEKEHIIRHTFFQMMRKPKMLNEVISYYNINKDIINLSDDDRTRLPSIINYDNYKLIEWCIDVLGVKVDNINYCLQKWIHSSRIFPFLVNKYYQDHPIPIYVNIFDYQIILLYQLSPKSFTNDVWSGILLSNIKHGVINVILWILKTYRFKLTERLAIKCIKKLFYGDITLIKEIIFYMMLYSKRINRKRYYKTYPPYVLCWNEKKMKIFI